MNPLLFSSKQRQDLRCPLWRPEGAAGPVRPLRAPLQRERGAEPAAGEEAHAIAVHPALHERVPRYDHLI